MGCGSGMLWKENADRINPDWDIVLFDQSPGMLEEARRPCDATCLLFVDKFLLTIDKS
ncbi:MAG: hypothetical protein ACM3ZC_12260 [Bacteroidota bacterium]